LGVRGQRAGKSKEENKTENPYRLFTPSHWFPPLCPPPVLKMPKTGDGVKSNSYARHRSRATQDPLSTVTYENY
jgi:hypothetical protein